MVVVSSVCDASCHCGGMDELLAPVCGWVMDLQVWEAVWVLPVFLPGDLWCLVKPVTGEDSTNMNHLVGMSCEMCHLSVQISTHLMDLPVPHMCVVWLSKKSLAVISM